MNGHLFGKELFIRFTASAFRKLLSVYVFAYFPFGFQGRIWDLIVSVPDHCLSFYVLIYVSAIRDKFVLAINALSMNLDRIHGHASLPFHIISVMLNKIRQFQCRIVLVTPLWPQRSWFRDLLQLLVSPPIRLPNVPDILGQLKGKFKCLPFTFGNL